MLEDDVGAELVESGWRSGSCWLTSKSDFMAPAGVDLTLWWHVIPPPPRECTIRAIYMEGGRGLEEALQPTGPSTSPQKQLWDLHYALVVQCLKKSAVWQSKALEYFTGKTYPSWRLLKTRGRKAYPDGCAYLYWESGDCFIKRPRQTSKKNPYGLWHSHEDVRAVFHHVQSIIHQFLIHFCFSTVVLVHVCM